MVEPKERSIAMGERVVEATVRCHCGAEMALRAEGVERAIPAGTGAVEFRGYVCPVCGSGRRYEYKADDDAWRRVES